MINNSGSCRVGSSGGGGCNEALNIRVVSDPGLGNLFSICRSLRGHGQYAWAGTLQGNISFLLRALGWMPRASHDLMCRPVWYKVEGRTLALTRTRDDGLCQRTGLHLKRTNENQPEFRIRLTCYFCC